MLFDIFENKQVITGVITAIDPIHIGSSGNEGLDPTQIDSSVLKGADGKPIIPGSSLKGVIRSAFSAALRSIGKDACDVLDNDKCCTTDKALKIIIQDKSMTEKEKAQKIYDNSCVACRLFGGHGIASHLSFKDCGFIGEKCIYEYRDGVGIDPDTGSAKHGAKYDYEIVPKGSRFEFYMTAENLDEDQEKYLDYILRLLESGELCVGGFTTRGLGRIQLSDVGVKKTNKEDLRNLLGL